MKRIKSNSGAWAVIVILALGVVLALVGLKFRRFPENVGRPSQPPAATHPSDRN